MRALAVRIADDLRAQLDVLAQLNDRSVTDEIRIALESWVETSRSDPQVLELAETVRAQIDREAKTKQADSLFDLEDAADAAAAALTPMISVQRETIRDLFAMIGVTSARAVRRGR